MSLALARIPSAAETADDVARAWQEYGIEYAKYPDLWRGCVLATLGPQQPSDRAWDYSGRNNHGTLTNGPAWQGKDGLSFDGTNDYVDVGNDAELHPSSRTISVWVKTAQLGGAQRDIVAMSNAAGSIFWRLLQNGANSDRVEYAWEPEANRYRYYATDASLALNTWTHISVTHTGTDAPVFYLSGLLASSYLRASVGVTGIPAIYKISIGRLGEYDGFYFNGLISDVRIYSRALSPTEIYQLYAAGRPGVTGGVYQVRKPQYFLFSTGGATYRRPWQIRRSRRMVGAR